MAEGAKTGLLDLEKELTCSVSFPVSSRAPWKADLMFIYLDMYRSSLPTAHLTRLPSYLLRVMPQGVVLMASLPSNHCKTESIHLPIMPCLCSRYETECWCHHPPGHVSPGQSK